VLKGIAAKAATAAMVRPTPLPNHSSAVRPQSRDRWCIQNLSIRAFRSVREHL